MKSMSRSIAGTQSAVCNPLHHDEDRGVSDEALNHIQREPELLVLPLGIIVMQQGANKSIDQWGAEPRPSHHVDLEATTQIRGKLQAMTCA
jgi:hypothetical protein